MADIRIAYGAQCAWWDTIDKAGSKPPSIGRLTGQVQSGLPCCPHCGGMLMEVGSPEEWWSGAERFEADGHPGYRGFLTWLQGRCFPSLDDAHAAFDTVAT